MTALILSTNPIPMLVATDDVFVFVVVVVVAAVLSQYALPFSFANVVVVVPIGIMGNCCDGM